MKHDTGLSKSGQESLLALVVLEILWLVTDISSASLITDNYSNNAMYFSAGNFALSYCIKVLLEDKAVSFNHPWLLPYLASCYTYSTDLTCD
jgi:hypothetical protein